jgi:hypothetical protein
MLLLEFLAFTARSDERKKESYSKPRDIKNKSGSQITRTRLIIAIILGFVAFYLSWQCNTALGYSSVEKACYALFAFLFGGVYIIMYLIFRAGTCTVGNGAQRLGGFATDRTILHYGTR